MNEMDAISYPANGHDQCLMVEDASVWFRHRNDCISSLVARYLPSGCLADVGGGNGYVAQRLQQDGLDIVLIEPGAAGARNAREIRGIRQVVEAPLSQAKASMGTLDAIGAFDVVEHIRDDAGFVREVADALGDGGLFFSTVPAHQWLWSDADVEAGHYRRYSRAGYCGLLSDRFEVLFASYYFGALVLPIALLRALPYRLGLHRRSTPETAARQHGTSGGLGARLLGAALGGEVARMARQKRIPFGASLIVVARKRATKK